MRDYVKLLDWLRSSQNACFLYGCDECPADCENHEGDIFNDAADAIEELVAAVPKWISVEERLPDVEQSVLICAFGRSVGEGTYRGHNGFHHVWKMYVVAGTYWDDEVTHWMPLPDPPKEDKL